MSLSVLGLLAPLASEILVDYVRVHRQRRTLDQVLRMRRRQYSATFQIRTTDRFQQV